MDEWVSETMPGCLFFPVAKMSLIPQSQSSHGGVESFDTGTLGTVHGTRDWFGTQIYQFVILLWTKKGGLQYLWTIFAALDSEASIPYSIDSKLYVKSDRTEYYIASIYPTPTGSLDLFWALYILTHYILITILRMCTIITNLFSRQQNWAKRLPN